MEEQMSGEQEQVQQLIEQGRSYYRLGEYKEALSCLKRAYEQCTTDDERHDKAEAANDIGVIYTVSRQWQEAEKWLNEAHRLFVELGDYDGEGQTLGNLGSMFRARGDLKQAAANLQLAADRFHLVGDDERRSLTLKSLSLVRLRQFRLLQAVAAYEAALACHPRPNILHKILRFILSLPRRLV